MAVPSPFQRTAADGEGVWASGMSHTHNELACCAIQYKKGKRKQKHKQQSRLAFIETIDTSNLETNWSSTGVFLTCHNNILSHFEESVAKRTKVKPIYFTGANDSTDCWQILNILRDCWLEI